MNDSENIRNEFCYYKKCYDKEKALKVAIRKVYDYANLQMIFSEKVKFYEQKYNKYKYLLNEDEQLKLF